MRRVLAETEKVQLTLRKHRKLELDLHAYGGDHQFDWRTASISVTMPEGEG